MRNFLSSFTKKNNSLLIEYIKLLFTRIVPIIILLENLEIKKTSEIITKLGAGNPKEFILFVLCPTIYIILRSLLSKKLFKSFTELYVSFKNIFITILCITLLATLNWFYFDQSELLRDRILGTGLAFVLLPLYWFLIVYDANEGYFKLLDDKELELSENQKKYHTLVYFLIIIFGISIGIYSSQL